MRLPDKSTFSFTYKGVATLAVATALTACSTAQGGSGDSLVTAMAPGQRGNGPAADYPITIGEPYFVNGTEYAPTDSLNYDHVGFAALDSDAVGYSASHHTLPLPSYAEITSLESGRTILVRVERRGPMNANNVVALSPAALAQLGGTPDTAVRVRRVNPPEEQRFLLRAGDAAPLRMDTPQSLLTVLRRRLPEPRSASASLVTAAAPKGPGRGIETISLAASEAETSPRAAALVTPELPAVTPTSAPDMAEVPAIPPLQQEDVNRAVASSAASGAFAAAFSERNERSSPSAATISDLEAEPAAIEQPIEGGFVVQAAAFSTEARADRAAAALGGFVMQAGRYWRVRTGPFATRGEAEASLANVRRAGYSDARIQTGG